MKKDENEDCFIREKYGSILKKMGNTDLTRCPAPDRVIDFLEGNLSGRNRDETEYHVVSCPFCLDAWEALRRQAGAAGNTEAIPENWETNNRSLNERFNASLRTFPAPARPQRSAGGMRPIRTFVESVLPFRSRIPAFAAGLSMLVLAGAYSLAYSNREPLFTLARVKPERSAVLRSASSRSQFRDGLLHYEKGEFRRAVSAFESDLKKHPDLYATRYLLGVSRLAGAERGLPGLHYRFNGIEVRQGMEDLEKALRLAGDNAYYRADCLWYLGKASLMAGDRKRALAVFSGLRRMNLQDSERPGQAARMLMSLDSARESAE
jgi:tetratricopeptide (TPR) repeat protein